MIGRSKLFRQVLALINKAAQFDVPVLIEGETGTGKELAARAIHYQGARSEGPFIPINCGALPDSLIENELFGHRRGAFTDARIDRPGIVSLACGGTLFLDEIDSLSAKAQVTLLRFLQDQRFRPLGGQVQEQGNVRIVAASNKSLDRLVEAGEFRMDLLYRLKLLHFTLPSLRERRGDISLLAEYFIQAGSKRFRTAALPLDAATLEWFERYHWPGNIRELENLIHRELLFAEGDYLSIPPAATGLRQTARASTLSLNYRQAKLHAIAEFESSFLEQLLDQAKGNVSAAARLAGTERRYLGRLLKKHGISRSL
jgi:DNA-binding NtrC family response regulator